MISKPKLSSLVSKQFPEFVREDYPKFISFVEAYYEFLEQHYNNDLYELRDIDTTLDSFLQQFRSELSLNIPYTKVNERFLLTHIKEKYLAKGSEASFKLLFRLLFNKEVQLSYPSNNVLRASDGKWNQEASTFVKFDFGNPYEISGKTITIQKTDRKLDVVVDRIEPVIIETDAISRTINPTTAVNVNTNIINSTLHGLLTGSIVLYSCGEQTPIGGLINNKNYYAIRINANSFKLALTQTDAYQGISLDLSSLGTGESHIISSGGTKQPSPNVYEVFINKNYYGTISPNDIVTYNDTVRGSILSTTSSLSIISGGKGFKVGEIYEVKNGTGFGSTIKITKVSAGGVILSAQIIKFGPDYGNSFTNTLVSYSERSAIAYNSLSVSIPNMEIGETYSGFIETGSMNTTDYNIDDSGSPAIDPTYSGVLIRQFYQDNTLSGSEFTTPAVIFIKTDGVAKYPGHWDSNSGFLNDAIYLQDSYYYQAFSYVVVVSEQLESYKNILKTLLHPAGMALFGEYEIVNTLDLGVSLQEATRIISLAFQEQIYTSVSIPIKGVGKYLTESQIIQESHTVSINKYIVGESISTQSSGAIWQNQYWDIMYNVNDTGYYTEGIIQEF